MCQSRPRNGRGGRLGGRFWVAKYEYCHYNGASIFVYWWVMSELFTQPKYTQPLTLWNMQSWSLDVGHNLQWSIYVHSEDVKLTSKKSQWVIKYQWDSYTVVYPEVVLFIYGELWVPIYHCTNWKEVTSYLKQYFHAYCDQYSALRKLDNRDNLPKKDISLECIEFSQMIHQWSLELQIPYLWYVKRWDVYETGQHRSKMGQTLAFWIPLSLNGKPLRLRDVWMAQRVSLDTPDDRACLIALLKVA